MSSLPSFPPLLQGHGLKTGEDPFDWAKTKAQQQLLSAGDLVWSADTNAMRFALVLEPEVSRERCAEMVYVAMVAFTDAIGAQIPPEVAVTYQWPHIILMNDGQIGTVDLLISDENDAEDETIPAWMVLGLTIQLIPDFSDMNPGENYHHTTLWDEGCGEITAIALLESTARHLTNAIYTWSQEGFKTIHQQWLGRLSKTPLPQEASALHQAFTHTSTHMLFNEATTFIGIDEIGQGLLAVKGQTTAHNVADILGALRSKTTN